MNLLLKLLYNEVRVNLFRRRRSCREKLFHRVFFPLEALNANHHKSLQRGFSLFSIDRLIFRDQPPGVQMIFSFPNCCQDVRCCLSEAGINIKSNGFELPAPGTFIDLDWRWQQKKRRSATAVNGITTCCRKTWLSGSGGPVRTYGVNIAPTICSIPQHPSASSASQQWTK